MVIKQAELDIVCGFTSRLPDTGMPEVAFAGKSNVGKSSLINGYARVSQSEKEKWGKMIERYLHTSRNLRAVFLLVDIRHAPSANDCQMYEWILHNGFQPIIIATKLDKLKRSQVQKNLKVLREGLRLEKETVIIPFSAETKQGREEIWELIESLIMPDSGEEA